MAFSDNVFINCPFDAKFFNLLRPLLFTVIYHGLIPRIALEATDSGALRLNKIVELIEKSQYAINDISRIKAAKAGDLSRLNMPFELGLDLGARFFGDGILKNKKCLVLEAGAYRYKAALSDLSGSDIAHHRNQPQTVVSVVRDWLRTQCGIDAGGPTRIWLSFNDFMAEIYVQLPALGYSKEDIDKLPVPELIEYMQEWVSANPDQAFGHRHASRAATGRRSHS